MDTARTRTERLPGGSVCRIEGGGPPLLLFHGGGGSWTHWIRNIPALRARYTVHAFDLPGFGDADTVPHAITDDAYVDLVCEGVRAIAGSGTVKLAGFSFGGVNATLVATRMPQTIEKLALVAPGGLGRVSNARSQFRKMPPDSAPDAEKRDVLRHNLLLMMLAHPQSVDDATIELQRDNVARTRFDSRRFTGSTYTRDALFRLRTPACAIFGALDNLSYPSVYARINPCASLRPEMPITVIPNAGHWVQYEAAPAVNKLLLDFFG
jgi:pimeloyl-ACP methyl ester carboxylesterase